jgi:hypothetical protein
MAETGLAFAQNLITAPRGVSQIQASEPTKGIPAMCGSERPSEAHVSLWLGFSHGGKELKFPAKVPASRADSLSVARRGGRQPERADGKTVMPGKFTSGMDAAKQTSPARGDSWKESSYGHQY